MQQLIQRHRIKTQQRVITADQTFFSHLHRHAQGGSGCPLSAARLQHIQLSLLDGEFKVLHVSIMRLKLGAHCIQLGKYRWHGLFHRHIAGFSSPRRCLGQRQRCTNAGHHIFALRIDQIFTVKTVLASRRVAREGHTGCAIITHIAKDHRLHIHGCAP